MSEILFLAHRVPFPPDRGDKIRSYHVLKHLATLAPIHVAAFADDEKDMSAGQELGRIAASHCLVQRDKSLVPAVVEAIAAGLPASISAYGSKVVREYVDRICETHPMSAIYVFSGQMGQFVPAGFRGRVIADLCDVDSAKFEAYAAAGRWPKSWLFDREGRLLKRWEALLAERADTTLLVSAEEAALLASRLDAGTTADVRVLANGIDAALFDPSQVAPESQLSSLPGPRLVFTGQMDYPPNIAAARRAATRIMPLIRQVFPHASLHIVGRAPTAEVRALDGLNGCRIHGAVPDIRGWLRAADLALVPLEIARGVQNKVLEALAMSLPVVLSPGAATGIAACDREHWAVAQTDAGLAESAISLLGDPARAAAMGAAARRFVVTEQSWECALGPLAELCGLAGQVARDAA